MRFLLLTPYYSDFVCSLRSHVQQVSGVLTSPPLTLHYRAALCGAFAAACGAVLSRHDSLVWPSSNVSHLTGGSAASRSCAHRHYALDDSFAIWPDSVPAVARCALLVRRLRSCQRFCGLILRLLFRCRRSRWCAIISRRAAAALFIRPATRRLA